MNKTNNKNWALLKQPMNISLISVIISLIIRVELVKLKLKLKLNERWESRRRRGKEGKCLVFKN